VLLKAAALFIIFNVLYVVVQPLDVLNRVSVYNVLAPGRLRFPFGEYPAESHSILGTSIDQMLVSHAAVQPKAPGEFRVLHIGDSAVWGYLNPPNGTQAACLDQRAVTLPDGRRLRAYNLGYPTLTLVKDVLILRHALEQTAPDYIIWSISLASFYPGDQLDFPLIAAQRDELADLIARYGWNLPQWPLPEPSWLDRTFFGQRRQLADWLRHQLYGLGWAATGVDQGIPRFVTPHQTSLQPDENLKSVNPVAVATPGQFMEDELAFDVLRTGMALAAERGVPVLLVNGPIFRSDASELRYNSYYPRRAYDSYRALLGDVAAREAWRYLDLWDAAPNDQFTDTEFHLTPSANCLIADRLAEAVLASPD
jgi:hypothetical protein